MIAADGDVQNDPTLTLLAKTAVSHAEAGADILSPSDMMDGRVAFIRQALDDAGYQNVSIMAHCAKFASAFSGLFATRQIQHPSLVIAKPIKWIQPPVHVKP